MDDTTRFEIELQYKVKAVLQDEAKIATYSISEQLAVALILNRPDMLRDLRHTMLEAAMRIGPDMLAAAYKVEQWYRDS